MGKPDVVVTSNEVKDSASLEKAASHDPSNARVLIEVSKDWQQPSKLERYQQQWTTFAYDTILILLPLGLLAKAIVASIFGLRMNTDGNLDLLPTRVKVLVSLDDQLVTLFTIIFATIIGTLVRRVALWRAQRGASVGTLEQLHASTSLPKAITSIWYVTSHHWLHRMSCLTSGIGPSASSRSPVSSW